MEKLKGRILCVDDDRDTCEMITALLGYAGYEVSHACSVAEGLSLAKSGGFDLILLDWYFDDGTGIDLCRMIRTFDVNIPILFYSGVANESDIKRAMSFGAQGFLVKPLGTENIVETVSRFVGNNIGQGQHAG